MSIAGTACQSQLQGVRVAEEAADEAADRQKECFAQSSLEAVQQPMPASHIPTKVKYEIIHITSVHVIPSYKKIYAHGLHFQALQLRPPLCNQLWCPATSLVSGVCFAP